MNHRQIMDLSYNLGFQLSENVLLDVVLRDEEWKWMPFSTSEDLNSDTLKKLARLLDFLNGK